MDPATAIELAAQAFGLIGVRVTVYAGVIAAVELALRELRRSALHHREIRITFTTGSSSASSSSSSRT